MMSFLIHKIALPLTLLSQSIFIALSSQNMFFIWMMMELNLMIFLIAAYSTSPSSKEVLIKYFIIQMISSFIFLLGLTTYTLSPQIVSSYIILLSMILKLGLAPLHFWVFDLLKNLQWSLYFLMMIIQKIIPLYIISSFWWASEVLFSLVIINGIFSCWMSFNVACLRKLLAISSMLFFSSLFMIKDNSEFLVTITLVYILFNFLFFLFLSNMNVFFMQQLNMKLSSKSNALMFFFYILSASGIPPFIGFFLKYFIAQEVMAMNLFSFFFIFLFFILNLWLIYMFINSCSSILLLFSLKKVMVGPEVYNKGGAWTFFHLFSLISLNLYSLFLIYLYK